MKIRKIVLLVLIAVLGVGTLTACAQNNSAEKGKVTLTAQEKKELRKEEDKIALYLINHYEDVKKIEFDEFYKGGFGTADSISVLVNSTSYIKPIALGDTEGEYVIGYSPNKFHLISKETPTTFTNLSETKTEVIYYGEDE